MEFFINHTHKQIAFAGKNAHLNKFLDKLSELVETKHWSFKDDIQLIIIDVDPYMTHGNVRTLLEEKKYVLLDEEYWYIFYPEQEEAINKAYDAEIEQQEKRYEGTTSGWLGWDTLGATFDV